MTTRSTVGKDVNTLRVQLLDSLSTNSGLTRAVSITLSAEMTRFIIQAASVRSARRPFLLMQKPSRQSVRHLGRELSKGNGGGFHE